MYNPFQRPQGPPYEFPRVKRRNMRTSIGARRGGNQLQPAQAPIQRPQGPPQRGMTSTTTGLNQQSQQQGGLLGGLLEAKGAYEGINDAYEGGGKIKQAIQNFDPRSISNIFSGGTIPADIVNSGKAAISVPGPLPVPDMAGAVGPQSYGAIPYGSESAFGGSMGSEGLGTGLNTNTISGGNGGGMGANLAYAKIGLDVIDGGPQGQKITGNSFGDAALRAGAAYFTGGLSEIGYMFL